MVFVGTPWQNLTDLIAIALGQVRDIKRHLADTLVQDVYNSEAAYRLHQAMGRGCCREIGADGRPKEMKAYMFLTDEQWNKIGPMLKLVLPGVQTPERRLRKVSQREFKSHELRDRLREQLRNLISRQAVSPIYRSRHTASFLISVQKLKRVVLQGVSYEKSHFPRVLDSVLPEFPGCHGLVVASSILPLNQPGWLEPLISPGSLCKGV